MYSNDGVGRFSNKMWQWKQIGHLNWKTTSMSSWAGHIFAERCFQVSGTAEWMNMIKFRQGICFGSRSVRILHHQAISTSCQHVHGTIHVIALLLLLWSRLVARSVALRFSPPSFLGTELLHKLMAFLHSTRTPMQHFIIINNDLGSGWQSPIMNINVANVVEQLN